MRNKRTLQRGLALLLAGGMALSNLGAVPALAEEYTPATEVTQTAPEEEVPPPEETVTDTTTNEDTDLSEGSESTSPTEEKVDTSGSAAEDKELLAIFESTYGKVKRRAFEPKRAPARTALDETRYNIKNQKTGPEYLLVDGYNIIFAWDALKKLAAQDVAAAREALAGILANYRGWRRCEIILVFDAYKVKGNPGSMEKKNGIYIVYTKEAQTADSYIERATYDLGKNHRVRVATSDNMEQVIILGHGALRISARAFEEEVTEAEGQISDLIERWNVRDFDLRRVRATATIIDKKEEKGS